jgi:chorismate dehydratase
LIDTDYPAQIATLLQNWQIDIGLVPVASSPRLMNIIMSEYCIGCDGPVAWFAFSEVTIAEIEEVLWTSVEDLCTIETHG